MGRKVHEWAHLYAVSGELGSLGFLTRVRDLPRVLLLLPAIGS